MDLDLSEEERRLLAADDRSTARTGLWIVAIFGLVGIAILIPVCQAVMWLRSGVWTALPISRALSFAGIDRPTVAWIGLQRIIDWLLGLPVAMASVFAFVGTVHLFTRNDHRPDSEALRSARMKRARQLRSDTGTQNG